MAKQKIVIKVTMENAKGRSKALKIAAGLQGIISTQIDGETLVVVGDGVDPIELTVALRKKMSFAELVNVSSAEEEKEKTNKDGGNKGVQQTIWPHQFAVMPPAYLYESRESDAYHDSCSTM